MTKPKAARWTVKQPKAVKNPAGRYVSDRQLANHYGVHRATVWRWAGDWTIPAPVKITDGCVRWIADEIAARDAALAAARDHEAA